MTKKKPPFLPATLDQQIGFQLRLAQLAAFSDLIETLKAEDLRPADVAALGVIEAHPGVRQLTVGQHLKIAKPNVVMLIDHLEQRDLVERTVDEKDRRANQLQLTPRGLATLKSARSLEAKHQQRLLDALGDVDTEAFMLGLRRIAALKQYGPQD